MIAILTEQNVERSIATLGPHDLLLSPELGKLTLQRLQPRAASSSRSATTTSQAQSGPARGLRRPAPSTRNGWRARAAAGMAPTPLLAVQVRGLGADQPRPLRGQAAVAGRRAVRHARRPRPTRAAWPPAATTRAPTTAWCRGPTGENADVRPAGQALGPELHARRPRPARRLQRPQRLQREAEPQPALAGPERHGMAQLPAGGRTARRSSRKSTTRYGTTSTTSPTGSPRPTCPATASIGRCMPRAIPVPSWRSSCAPPSQVGRRSRACRSAATESCVHRPDGAETRPRSRRPCSRRNTRRNTRTRRAGRRITRTTFACAASSTSWTTSTFPTSGYMLSGETVFKLDHANLDGRQPPAIGSAAPSKRSAGPDLRPQHLRTARRRQGVRRSVLDR